MYCIKITKAINSEQFFGYNSIWNLLRCYRPDSHSHPPTVALSGSRLYVRYCYLSDESNKQNIFIWTSIWTMGTLYTGDKARFSDKDSLTAVMLVST